MVFAVENRVRCYTATSGTGTLTITSTVFGCQSFTDAGLNGKEVTYCIADPVTGAWEVGEGIYTSFGTTLTRRNPPLASSNAGSLLNLAGNPTTQVALVMAAERELHRGNFTNNADGYRHIAEGRLTTESGVPVSSSNRTSQSVLYYTPYVGREVSTYLGDVLTWIPHRFEEIAVQLSGLNSARPYDVGIFASTEVPTGTNTSTNVLTIGAFGSTTKIWQTGSMVIPMETGGGLTAGTVYWYRRVTTTTGTLHTTLAGALADTGIVDITATITSYLRGISLFLSSWNTDTSRAIAPTMGSHGIFYLSTEDIRYLGTVYTTSSSTIEDSGSKRYVWNFYNQVRRPCTQVGAGSTAAYTTTGTYRSAGNDNNVRFYIVNGMDFSMLGIAASNRWSVASGAQAGESAIGRDSMTTRDTNYHDARYHNGSVIFNATIFMAIPWSAAYVPIGHHYYQLIEKQDAATSTSWHQGTIFGDWLC